MRKIKWYYIKLLIKHLWGELAGTRSKRFQARPSTHIGFEVFDTYTGAVIKSDSYIFREHEAEAVADALNRVVVPGVYNDKGTLNKEF